MSAERVRPRDVRVGDMADHRSGTLDPRPVAEVDGSQIRLQIGSIVTDRLPKANYRFFRWTS